MKDTLALAATTLHIWRRGRDHGGSNSRKDDEFDSSKEEWPQYVERLGHFFTANDIKTAEKEPCS